MHFGFRWPVVFANLDDSLIQVKQALFRWLVPSAWEPAASILLSIALVIFGFAALFAVVTLLERKGLGRIQNRPGPNRVGPFGLFQPAADGIKMLIKEDLVPQAADKVVHFLAPLVLLAPVTLAFAVLPYGHNLAPVNLDAGLLFFFAVGSAAELAAFMAGWSSRNKYSLLGAMRAIAQMISFELPLVVSTVPVIMLTGSLSLVAIVDQQTDYVWGWNVFTPWGLAGFFLFMVAATAESNRSPFDLPEGESEIIGGFMTEYSGFKYAVFFMGEYFGMFAVCGLATTLFLGGWHAPLPFLFPSCFWFFLKLILLVFGFIWIRGTLPRLRVDQLMGFSWKFLLPLSLLNLVIAALWHFTAGWQFLGSAGLRWVLGVGILLAAFFGLGGALMRQRRWGPRVYRFAGSQ
jgi:NADH-quinone oxidoreductase subunit H